MADLQRRNRQTAAAALAVVLGMVGMAYAAVPLYDLFCRVTGYGGTTQVAEAAPGAVGEQTVTVRFNADMARGLGWRFHPAERAVTVRVGEEAMTHYVAENVSDRPITGTATYNVAPDRAGIYFSKIACFCFTEQTLQPGERVEMPVSFFVDPAILDDRRASDVRTITLSYTFFPAPERAVRLSEAPREGTAAAGQRVTDNQANSDSRE